MASRLEAMTKQVGRSVLLSGEFAELVKGEFELESIGKHALRGFNDPVELFAYHG
jgi:adenylate cyclase